MDEKGGRGGGEGSVGVDEKGGRGGGESSVEEKAR